MNFFLDWLFEALRFLLLYTGVVTWALILVWVVDYRTQRRAWSAAVNRRRQWKAARAQAAAAPGSFTRLHGAACRCILCDFEGKGKGGRSR